MVAGAAVMRLAVSLCASIVGAATSAVDEAWLKARMEAAEPMTTESAVLTPTLLALEMAELVAPFQDSKAWRKPGVKFSGNGAPATFAEMYGRLVDADEPFSAVLRLEHLEEAPVEALRRLAPVDLTRDTAHVYLSSPGASALANHTDVTDVLVIQLVGSKEWIFCPPRQDSVTVFDTAKLGQCTTYDDVEMADLDRCERATLSPGSIMYLPRRTVHSARATADEPSVHLTVGFRNAATRDDASCRAYRDAVRAALNATPAVDRLVSAFPEVRTEAVHLLAESVLFGDSRAGDAVSVLMPPDLEPWLRVARAESSSSRHWRHVADALQRAHDAQAPNRLWLEFDVDDDDAAPMQEPGLFQVVDSDHPPRALLDEYFAVFDNVSLDPSTRARYDATIHAIDALDGDVVDQGFFHGRAEDDDVISVVRLEVSFRADVFATAAAVLLKDLLTETAASSISRLLSSWTRCALSPGGQNIISLDVDASGVIGFGLTYRVEDVSQAEAREAVQCLEEAEVVPSDAAAAFETSLDDVYAEPDDDDVVAAVRTMSHFKVKVSADGSVKQVKEYVRIVGRPLSGPAARRRLTVCSSTGTQCPAGYYSSNGQWTGYDCNEACDMSSCDYAGINSCDHDESCDESCDRCEECDGCEPGRFNTASGQRTCTNCPTGKFQSSWGKTSCSNCPAGRYQQATGSSSCTALCAAGKYSGSGATRCSDCPSGKVQPAQGQASCVDCGVGKFESELGQAECDPAKPGYFVAAEGSTSETKCPIGKSQADTGQASCDSCPRGRYADATGQVVCTDCE